MFEASLEGDESNRRWSTCDAAARPLAVGRWRAAMADDRCRRRRRRRRHLPHCCGRCPRQICSNEKSERALCAPHLRAPNKASARRPEQIKAAGRLALYAVGVQAKRRWSATAVATACVCASDDAARGQRRVKLTSE